MSRDYKRREVVKKIPQDTMFVILISGKKGHGKDFLCNTLKDKIHKNGSISIHYRFAERIKTSLCELFNCSEQELETLKRNKPSVRDIHITLANLAKEVHGNNYFAQDVVDVLLSYMVENIVTTYNKRTNKFIIIPDWRFLNEYRTLRKHIDNIYTIRVENENCKEIPSKDKSETELDKFNSFDYVFTHDGNGLSEENLNSLINSIHTKFNLKC